MKVVRYRLGISRTVPATHARKGEQTLFVDRIMLDRALGNGKKHTIRGNYPLWKKRMDKVQAGSAVIELFYWEGKPYNSKQFVFLTLDKDSGCGVQELGFMCNPECVEHPAYIDITKPFVFPTCSNMLYRDIDVNKLCENDGLSLSDFKEWFKSYDLSEPMAIIHFTKFRY
jgi:hypothetical protein